MQPEIQHAYLQELRSQCLIAHQAIEDMTNLMIPAHVEAELAVQVGVLVPRFWYCTQAFLAAAANISKLLWPPSTKAGARKRGRELRALIGGEAAADDSALNVAGRTLRNLFEHFDERLDTWAERAEATGDPSLVVRVVWAGPPEVFEVNPHSCFLYFDASSYRIIVEGQVYEILPLSWAIHALVERVDDLLGTPSSLRLQSPQDSPADP